MSGGNRGEPIADTGPIEVVEPRADRDNGNHSMADSPGFVN